MFTFESLLMSFLRANFRNRDVVFPIKLIFGLHDSIILAGILTGQDLIEAGVEPGPAMGKRMTALKALWVRSGFTADKTRLLAALKLMGGVAGV